MSAIAIRALDLGKRYLGTRHATRSDLRDTLSRISAKAVRGLRSGRNPAPRKGEEYWALRHVSFEFAKGSVVGILGNNGGGKTTLLRILAGITHPTEGCAEIRGRVGALLDGYAGFHSELTGRDNIFLLGAILGMSRTENDDKFEAIAHFAEVEDFIETPLKFYSTGMCARLAFAVAAHADSEILIVDEVLGVADREYQQKSLKKMAALAKAKRTVLFVSHDLELVRELCTHGMVLEEGRVAFWGSADAAVDYYSSGGGLSEARLRRA